MAKPPITLSINPSYLCNFRCEFCYLTHEQLKDKTTLPLARLQEMLADVARHYEIVHIDLYGGEPMLLGVHYLQQFKVLVKQYVSHVNVNTNLSVLNPAMLDDPFFDLSVSFDFEAREKSEAVMANMFHLTRPFSVLMLASPKLMALNVDTMVNFFNIFGHLRTVEVKPYSTNQANRLHAPYRDFEDFVKRFSDCKIRKNFAFTNEQHIWESLDRTRNAFSDDHLYITPQGQFAVLEFDPQDHEYFLPLEDIADYQHWCQVERQRVKQNAFCSSCEFYGHCLSEHLREVKSLTDSCNGFYSLLKWAEETWQE